MTELRNATPVRPRNHTNGPFPYAANERIVDVMTAGDRGWGAGWPNCQSGKQVIVKAVGIRWQVRTEAAALITALVTQWHATVEPLVPGVCGGFACRPVRGTEKDLHPIPSDHSWGLAVDLNTDQHPFRKPGTYTDAQVRAIRRLLAEPPFQRFVWGGDFRPHRVDEMHVEYHGTPEQVGADTALLRTSHLTLDLVEDDMQYLLARHPDGRVFVVTPALTTKRHVSSRVDLASLKQTGIYVELEMTGEQLAHIPDAP